MMVIRSITEEDKNKYSVWKLDLKIFKKFGLLASPT